MPSSRPIANSGCGVGPLYSRTSAIGASPSQAIAPARPRELALLEVADARRRRTAGRARGRSAGGPCRSSSRATIEPRRPTATVAISRPTDGRAGRSRRRPSAAGRLGRAAGSRGARHRRPALARSRWPRAAPGSNGAAQDALLGDDPGDELGRRDVEGGVADLGAGRRDADAAELEDLVGAALLDRDRGAVRRREVDRAGRRADVERDAVAGRQHGQRVGADLVRGVAVGRDPVRADEHDVDLAACHQVPGGHVGDQRVRDAGLGQLPGRQPGALEVRPRLVDPDVDRSRPAWCAAWTTPSAVPYWPQASGPVLQWVRIRTGRSVRDGQDLQPERRPAGRGRSWPRRRSRRPRSRIASAIASPSSRQLADLVVAGHDPLDRPAQVDRGRPGVDQRVGRAAERRPARVRPAVALRARRSSPARSPRPGRSPARRGRSSRGSRRRPRRPTGTGTRRARRAAGAGR